MLLGEGPVDSFRRRCPQSVPGAPLILAEGQQCEYSQRRRQVSSFDEEAIAQLLCILGQDFTRAVAKRRVRIMRTNMTTLT